VSVWAGVGLAGLFEIKIGLVTRAEMGGAITLAALRGLGLADASGWYGEGLDEALEFGHGWTISVFGGECFIDDIRGGLDFGGSQCRDAGAKC